MAFLAVPLIALGVIFANPSNNKNGSASEPSLGLDDSAPGVSAPAGIVNVIVRSEFAQQLLDNKRVSVENTASGIPITLTSGENHLPPGEYLLHIVAPVDLQEEGRVIEVKPSSTTPLPLSALLTKSFQYPDFPPDNAGASYYVGINDSHYDLELKAISVPNPRSHGSSSEKWLIVSNTQSLENGNFTETASLKIDELAWQNYQQLEILEGWIEVDSPSVQEYLANHSSNNKGSTLVKRFDLSKDSIAAIESLKLPENRLSIHDILVLFFGADDMAAAKQPFRELRKVLGTEPESRFAWLGTGKAGKGEVDCYVVSSGKQAESLVGFGFMMQRCTDEPFGFLRLEAKTETFEAICNIIKSGNLPPTPVLPEEIRTLPDREWRMEENHPKSIDREPQRSSAQMPMDKAIIPLQPMTTKWYGTIARDNGVETLRASASMLGRGRGLGVYEGLDLCLLEIEVNSNLNGSDHWEKAYLYIDSSAYEKNKQFKIMQGWFAFDDQSNMFYLPSNGDLNAIIDARLQRQSKTRFDRIGVADVLSMLFDAELKPKSSIGVLRESIAGLFLDIPRSTDPGSFTTKEGITITGDLWTCSSLILGSKYSILRSDDVPFSFVRVHVNVPKFPEIKLHVDSFQTIDADYRGLHNDLCETAQRNHETIGAKARVNWRVWTWEHAGTTYKLWAEFGGKLEYGGSTYVVLVDRAHRTVRVPFSDFSEEADRNAIELGRIWASGPQDTYQALEADNTGTGIIKLKRQGNMQTIPYRIAELHQLDRQWLDRLRTLAKQPNDLARCQAEWRSTVEYPRTFAPE